MKKAEVRKPLLEMIEQVVFPLGFEKQKTCEGWEYVKNRPSGFIGICPILNQYDSLFFISLTFSMRISEIQDIINIFQDGSEKYYQTYPTLNFGITALRNLENDRFRVETFEDLEYALNVLKSIIENEGLHFFEKFQSTIDLDEEFNRENRPKDLYCSEVRLRPFVGLTAAVLSNNPKKHYWENYYREKLQNANQHIKSQYENLVSYLKENYPPAKQNIAAG